MNKLFNLGLRVVFSVFISGLAVLLVSSLVHWVSPEFSVDFVDMLAQPSPSAWMLLALASAIVFVALARLRPFRGSHQSDCPESSESE